MKITQKQMIVLLLLAPVLAFGQDINVAVKHMEPGVYLGEIDSLELSSDQFVQRGKLLGQFRNWESKIQFKLAQDVADGEITEEKYAAIVQGVYLDYYESLKSHYTVRQQKLLDQFILAKFYSQTQRAKLKLSGDFSNTNFAVLHPEISEKIGLSKQQAEIIKSPEMPDSTKLESDAKKLIRKVIDTFPNWNDELLSILTEQQIQTYRRKIGPEFEFPSELLPDLRLVYRDRPLFIAKQSPTLINEVDWSAEEPIDMLKTRQFRLDAPYEINSLFAILDNKKISVELQLTDQQRGLIDDLKFEWFLENPLPRQFKVITSFGFDPEISNANQPANQAGMEKRITKILNDTQKNRLNQIWNQVFLRHGWHKVPLAYNGWIECLELTKSQVKKYHATNIKYRSSCRKLWDENQRLTQLFENVVSGRSDIVKQTLTPDQRKALEEIFGPYAFTF